MDNDNLSAEDLLAALKESEISAENFTEELKLLLNGFFTCSVNSRGKNITVDFLNGQSFKIKVKKLKR